MPYFSTNVGPFGLPLLTATGGVVSAVALIYVPHFVKAPLVFHKLAADRAKAKKDGAAKIEA
jgi:hypothetical protein